MKVTVSHLSDSDLLEDVSSGIVVDLGLQHPLIATERKHPLIATERKHPLIATERKQSLWPLQNT
jgi:hypothetical protein